MKSINKKLERLPLPVDDFINEIVDKVVDHSQLVINASPGSGKTTRVPPAVASRLKELGKTIVLQPRRIAVRSSSERIAFERNWKIGSEIGYQMRFETHLSKESFLVFMTEGTLSQKILVDPFLKGISVVILDEFHERSAQLDFAIAWIKKLQKGPRPDLKMIIMSATISIAKISNYLPKCQLIEVPGLLHPLEKRFARRTPSINNESELFELALQKIETALIEGRKGTLFFLPGRGEIDRFLSFLNSKRPDLSAFSLHGGSSFENQKSALEFKNKYRVIAATNVAETSLTVDGIDHVIDSGTEKVVEFDAKTGVKNFGIKKISQESADQRAGRAARSGPGLCDRLWTLSEQNFLSESRVPEVHRIDMTDFIFVTNYVLNKNLPPRTHSNERENDNEFGWFSPLSDHQLEFSKRFFTLSRLIDSSGNLTKLGETVASTGFSCRQSLFIFYAKLFESEELASSLLAILESEQPTPHFEKDDLFDKSQCDIHFLADKKEAFASFRKNDNFLRVKKHYLKKLKDQKKISNLFPDSFSFLTKNKNDLREILLLVYPDYLTKRREKRPNSGLLMSGRGIKLSQDSCAKKTEPLFISYEPTNFFSKSFGKNNESMVSKATSIPAKWIEHHFADLVETEEWIERDKKGGKCFRGRALMGFHFDKAKQVPLDKEKSKEIKRLELLRLWPELLNSNEELEQWSLRLSFLKEHCPEFDWPELDKDFFEMISFDLIENGITAQSWPKSSLVKHFNNLLSISLLDAFEKLAPTSIKFALRERQIEYSAFRKPSVKARIQDVWGINEAPKIAGGKISLIVDLQAPSQRIVQSTDDLATFWQTSYLDIRKELKGRYPKHHWPLPD